MLSEKFPLGKLYKNPITSFLHYSIIWQSIPVLIFYTKYSIPCRYILKVDLDALAILAYDLIMPLFVYWFL